MILSQCKLLKYVCHKVMSLFDIPTIFCILIIINLDKYYTVCCYELFPIVNYFDSQNMTQLFLYTFLSIKIVQCPTIM